MATINKTIEMVDSVVPNTYDDESKFQWMMELDGLVAREVMQMEEPPGYSYPEDMDTELLIPRPYDRVYALYMEAMIDLQNRDYDGYNNTIQVFDALFSKYKKAHIRENRPASAGYFKNL